MSNPTDTNQARGRAMSIQEQVAIIVDELPIEYPRQVYVRQNQEYIQSYDPVSDIRITDTGIEIQGEPYLYTHTFDEFNRIYITENEPVNLKENR